jgi:hypothetical protein
MLPDGALSDIGGTLMLPGEHTAGGRDPAASGKMAVTDLLRGLSCGTSRRERVRTPTP